ncbi:hypothetical protein BDBG_17767 [Blastomyces gilchristii SLH14081]|uniref:Uncharacterized protein n=3 Tax=Blastomyces TaxID=229219 RepID=A0A179UYU6_BLAGS|nr:uncharacterized protein BDBG_17767 [Blastomyces gilchristii SLH14081]OAT13275.1 hypothetical protein BDBG_17767 [Blastomyces gilchristii SLH14081]
MMNPTQLWLPGGIAGLLTLSMVVVWTDCLQRLGGVKAWAGSERQSQFRIQEYKKGTTGLEDFRRPCLPYAAYVCPSAPAVIGRFGKRTGAKFVLVTCFSLCP